MNSETKEFVSLFEYLARGSSGGRGLGEDVNMRVVEGMKTFGVVKKMCSV